MTTDTDLDSDSDYDLAARRRLAIRFAVTGAFAALLLLVLSLLPHKPLAAPAPTPRMAIGEGSVTLPADAPQWKHLDLAVLEDDNHYFPPYEAVPVVREQTLAEHPEIGQALNGLADQISDAEMRELNYEVDGKKRDVKQVVGEFLRSKGL